MSPLHTALRTSALLAAAFTLSCSGGDDTASDTSDTAPVTATWDDVRPIVQAHCARCHSADRLSTYRRLETHQEVSRLAPNILAKLETEPERGQRMPLASNHVGEQGCEPQHAALNDKRLTDTEQAMLVAYLQRTDHVEYDDTYERLSAPVVEPLANATEYVSSQYDVVNDGFLDPPGGGNAGYMEEQDYDQREYDQMEDDWFCIQFDPARTDTSFITGVQAQTAIGQIFLNSQLVIDTTGASDTARADADESGPDWYRCDAGLGFADAVPLWRTVPGGSAVELPDSTGLRFEPGWRFVLRADFHTHFDDDEFERLDQNGFIDQQAGTMTWFDQATLRVRWAEPSQITRELQWLTVEPSSQAERDGFAVPPGDSVRTYSASVPDGEYAVFSAEVGAGKNAHTLSLTDTSTSTCVANNGDFSPKWIEHVVYGEDDAPLIDGDSELELSCSYSNKGDSTVAWGPEGEAAAWGRRERCSAVVFYYERG